MLDAGQLHGCSDRNETVEIDGRSEQTPRNCRDQIRFSNDVGQREEIGHRYANPGRISHALCRFGHGAWDEAHGCVRDVSVAFVVG